MVRAYASYLVTHQAAADTHSEAIRDRTVVTVYSGSGRTRSRRPMTSKM
jgi:D-arabinose 5-phosphate isomerase GutQ